jgi:hypothetical protein
LMYSDDEQHEQHEQPCSDGGELDRPDPQCRVYNSVRAFSASSPFHAQLVKYQTQELIDAVCSQPPRRLSRPQSPARQTMLCPSSACPPLLKEGRSSSPSDLAWECSSDSLPPFTRFHPFRTFSSPCFNRNMPPSHRNHLFSR